MTTVSLPAASGLQARFPVSALLTGTNIEVLPGSRSGMLSEKLENPFFTGPAHPQTGIAQGWHPLSPNLAGAAYELTLHRALSGISAQKIQKTHRSWVGLLQPGVSLYADEELVVEFWAAALHHPVRVSVVLTGSALTHEHHHTVASFTVDTSYWKKYTARISPAVDDPHAVFQFIVEENGCLWLDQIHLRPVEEPLLRRSFVRRLEELQPPVIRFPGGSISNFYHWRHGIGPAEKRGETFDDQFHGQVFYVFGTDEYLELCQRFAMTPYLSVNIVSGTPEDAAEWAAYCRDWFARRELPVPAAYFNIGNENYGIWEQGHMSPEMYVRAVEAFSPPLRLAYPEARIVVQGEIYGNGLENPREFEWQRTLLDQCAPEHYDVLSFQRYAGYESEAGLSAGEASVDGVADPTRHAHARSVALLRLGVRNVLADLLGTLSTLDERRLDKRVALTEWNLWKNRRCRLGLGDERHRVEPDDAEHVLFVAGVLNELIRHGDRVEMANIYSLINHIGIWAQDGREILVKGLSRVLECYRKALPGDLLDFAAPPDAPGLDLVLLRSEAGTALLAINWSAEGEVRFEPQSPLENAVLFSTEHLEKAVEPRLLPRNELHPGLSLPPLSVLCAYSFPIAFVS